MDGISALYMRVQSDLPAPSTMWDHKKNSATWKRHLAWPWWHPDLRLSAPKTVRHKFLLSICYNSPNRLGQEEKFGWKHPELHADMQSA